MPGRMVQGSEGQQFGVVGLRVQRIEVKGFAGALNSQAARRFMLPARSSFYWVLLVRRCHKFTRVTQIQPGGEGRSCQKTAQLCRRSI